MAGSGDTGDGDVAAVVPVGGDGGWVPEFPGQRPPVEPGNQLAVTHKARSEQSISALAERFEAALQASPHTPGYLKTGQFARPIRAWARAEAQCDLLTAYLDEVGLMGALVELTEGKETESRPRPGGVRRKMRQTRALPAFEALHRVETRAANLRARLGLDPQSFAALAKDVSLTRRLGEEDPLVKMQRKGRQIKETRERIEAEARARGEDPWSAWQAWVARNPDYAGRE